MLDRTKTSAARCALLLLLVSSPAVALSLGVLPAQPVEGSPFTLLIGVTGSCPSPAGITTTPGSPPVVRVPLEDFCLSPPFEQVIEVPLGPLQLGPWLIRVEFGGQQASLLLEVQRPSYQVEIVPPHPRAGQPFTVHFTGSGACPELFTAVLDGKLLSILFDDSCPIMPIHGGPFEIDLETGPLPAGDYAVQVTDTLGITLASRRFHVFGPSECVPSETALCLQEGRFRVEASWRTAAAQGVARVSPETADSGSLWFFNPENLEMLVKVLDACQGERPRFWVFAAGLTDVEVELVVTDVPRQVTRRYLNPLGTPFTPILDTSAFPCPLTDQ